jgi:predicted 2-oxoglutarate/Fe(II)-dependent dioxygenase YbiX
MDLCRKLLGALVGPMYHRHLTHLFVRKYSPDTRQSLPCHFDLTTFSIVIALNDPDEYEGGEFVCYPEGALSELTASAINVHGGVPTNIYPSAKRKLALGEVVVLYGKGKGADVFNRNLHCVHTVTRCTRYTLCAFYDIFDGDVIFPPRHPHLRQFRMR